MSLAERLVLLHVGSTVVLLVILLLVAAVRHVVERLAARRADRAVRASAPVRPTPLVRVREPRSVDAHRSSAPRVEGATRRAS